MQNAATVYLPRQATAGLSKHPRFGAAMLLRPRFGRRDRALALLTDDVAVEANEQGGWILKSRDVRQFLTAYIACFVVVMGMIA